MRSNQETVVGKFITDTKKAQLKRNDGKLASSAAIAKLAISDFNQRVHLAVLWGYSKEEAINLVEEAFAWWQAANNQEKTSKKLELKREGPPPGVGQVKIDG